MEDSSDGQNSPHDSGQLESCSAVTVTSGELKGVDAVPDEVLLFILSMLPAASLANAAGTTHVM
eukprot:4593891-Pyramimonas_sp.AAC.1